jgi:hypothetical protein
LARQVLKGDKFLAKANHGVPDARIAVAELGKDAQACVDALVGRKSGNCHQPAARIETVSLAHLGAVDAGFEALRVAPERDHSDRVPGDIQTQCTQEGAAQIGGPPAVGHNH